MKRLLLAGMALVGAGIAGWYGAVAMYEAPGPLPTSRDVVITRGDISQLGQALKTARIIRSVWAFRAAELATSWQGPLHAGELSFPGNASLDQVLTILRFGRPVQHRLTIAEGLSAAQIAALLAREEALTGDMAVPREGSVLPETYAFERGASRDSVLHRAAAAMRMKLAILWDAREAGLPMASAREAVVLASIVERETAQKAERPIVARVFLNRLQAGMRLQADPTAAYGASGGLGVMDRKLDRDDLERKDGYNTYVIMGLPAAPICSPGLASIAAVLHPARSDALYFVADGKGGHAFANRLDDHERNVARFRSLAH